MLVNASDDDYERSRESSPTWGISQPSYAFGLVHMTGEMRIRHVWRLTYRFWGRGGVVKEDVPEGGGVDWNAGFKGETADEPVKA